MPIKYLSGDATLPEAKGPKIIAHICNDAGGWGKGFVVAISQRWSKPEAGYRAWYKVGKAFNLGRVQLIEVEPDIIVANMLAQHGYRGRPIRYAALELCLRSLRNTAKLLNASVHMPRIGTGLAGGNWALIEPMIEKELCNHSIDVTVYNI